MHSYKKINTQRKEFTFMKRFAIFTVILSIALIFSNIVCSAESSILQNDVNGGFDLEYSGVTFTEDRNGNANSAILLSGDYWMNSEIGSLGAALEESKELTLSAFVRIDATPDNYHHVLSLQRADGNYVAMLEDAWDQYVLRSFQTGSEYSNTAYAGGFTLSTWKNVAITIGNGYAIIYVDGTEVAYFNADANLVFEDIKYFSVGVPAVNCELDANRSAFNGAIDDIKIYTEVLSASDIALLAAGNSVGTPAASFNCDEKADSDTSIDEDTSVTPDEEETPIMGDNDIYVAVALCFVSLLAVAAIFKKNHLL